MSLLLVVSAVVGALIIWHLRKPKWPPGPKGLPFIGNALQLDINNAHKSLTEWKKQFGDICHFNLFGNHVIMVSGYEEIKDVYVNMSNEFANRPKDFRMSYVLNFNSAVVWRNISPAWSDMKKNMIAAVKWFGAGQTKLELMTLQILDELISDIQAKQGEPFDPNAHVIESVNAIVASLTFGFHLRGELLERMIYMDNEGRSAIRAGGPASELDIFPWLRIFPNAGLKRITMLKKMKDDLVNDVKKIRKESFDPNDPSCLLDKLWVLQEQEKVERGKNVAYTDSLIHEAVFEMIAAGTTTTVGAVNSFLAICANYPEVQRHIQADLDRVLGERPPKLADRGSLPYVEATIFEILRYIAHVPLGVFHSTAQEVKLKGYTIPADTQVWVNSWSLHHDERYWDEPWSFKPERFLDQQGNILPHEHPTRKHFLAFGAGRRVCAGEILGKNRLFLFIASLLQRFTFLPVEGIEKPNCDPRSFRFGVTMKPNPYKIKAVERFS